ncbi:MAG: hypothetical protein IKO65_07695, partial [Victivallales bacterium]|nr:hypothetical protein [Victivallales bacterium]
KLLALGWWIDEVTYISDAIHFDTANFELSINELYEICLNYKDSKFNFPAFQNKQVSFVINYETQRLTQTSSINTNNEQIITVGEKKDTPSWLTCIDNALVTDLGFSFSLLQLVESLLLELNSNTMDFPILIFSSQTELCKKLFELISDKTQVKIELIHKCIDFLISHPITESSPILPSRIRMYKHRLHISPIILYGQQLAYGKQIVSISKRVIFNLFNNGLHPFDLSGFPHIKQEVEAIHKVRDRELENRIYQIACRVLGQNMAIKNLKNFQSISPKLDKFPECGEIDLLAVNSERRIVYVVDAKNQHNVRTPSGISRENDRFFGNNGHVEQLKKKTQYIVDNLPVFLNYFSIHSSNGWRVQNAFVSDKMFISGFLEGNDIDFVDINEFEKYLLNGTI